MSNDARSCFPSPSPAREEGRRASICCGAKWLLVPILCVSLAQVGHAQREEAPGGVESVFLDTDAAAAKKLGAARDLLAARQWGDGIDLVRQIAEQHGDRMVAIGQRRYVSVATYCDILLSTLPEAGLKLYRARTDGQARRWFEGAQTGNDDAGLTKIVRRAYLSTYGDDALLLLGQIAWQRGNLSQARSYWEQLLPLEQPPEPGQLPGVLRYPESGVDPAKIRARLVLCSLMQGQSQRAQRELTEFKRLHPQAEGTIAGKSGNLSRILTECAAGAARESFPFDDAEVRTFAGNARRNQVQSQPVDVGSIKWTIPMSPVKAELPPRGDELFERLPQDVLSYYPLVYNNLVFYCDETTISACELLSTDKARPAWGKEPVIYSLPEEKMGTSTVRRLGMPRYTLSIDNGRLFAHLGGGTARGRNRGAIGSGSLLVCLDLNREGDLLWSRKPDDLEEEGGAWIFDGAPLAVAGKVYVAVRRREPQLQLNVACFDAAGGKLLWNRKVCLGLEHFWPEVAEINHQLLTIADERLYYCTNRGAIAALDIHDGSPHWMATYPRADVESAGAFNKRQTHGPNPCVYSDGQLFVAPTDSDQVLAYDAETGLLQWSRELKGNVHQLVGVDDGKLIAAGDRLWALDVEDGRPAWIAGRTDPEAATRGRCAIAGGIVYWPRREELILVETSTGRQRREVDLHEQHGVSGGGNVMLTDGFLLLGQTNRIVAFSEFGSLRKRREDQIAREPQNPRPHFELALLAEATNELELARSSFARARDLSRPADRSAGLSLKEMATRRLVRLLLREASEAQAAENRTDAIARLTEAADVARMSDLQYDVWPRLAKVHEKASAPDAAVAVWQKLLDAAVANLDHADRNSISAARQARSEIDRLIAAHGRSIYSPIEPIAESSFAAALRDRDLRRTASLVAQYPNALATDRAALQLAALQRTGGDSYGSDRTYKERLAVAAGDGVRAEVLAGLALNAESRRGWRSARKWWQQLYDHHAGMSVTIEGVTRPIHDVVSERLEQIRRQPGISGPRNSAAIPLLRNWERAVRPGSVLIVPQGSAPSDELGCVLAAGETLTCVNTSDGNERWQAELSELPSWAQFVSDVLIVGTATTAIGIAPDNGRILWQRSFETTAGNTPAPELSLRATPECVYCLSATSGIWSLFPETGATAWHYHRPRGALQSRWHCGSDRLVVQRMKPDLWEVIDTRDGTLLGEGPGPNSPWREDPLPLSADRLLATIDDRSAPHVLDLKLGTAESFGETPFAIAGASLDAAQSDSALVAIVDSEMLSRLDPVSGSRLWSCLAGVERVLKPRSAVCHDGERLYAATAGIVRCHALDNGRLLWEQYVGPRGDWHVVRAGPWLAVFRQTSVEQSTIVLCDPASGDFVERLKSDGPTNSVQFHSMADQAVVVTDTRLIGFRGALPDSD